MNNIYRFFNLLATLAVIAVNILANLLPINDYQTGDLAALYPNLFVPAGITFSIWSLIYLALLSFSAYQLLPSRRAESKAVVNEVGPWFIISCALNIGWIYAWHYLQVILSVFIMLSLLVVLIIIYQRLEIGQKKVAPYRRWLAHAPFSLYLGWISIATVANITAMLVAINWHAYGIAPNFWAAAMIFIAALLGLFMVYRAGDWLYALVLLWAFGGIALKRWLFDPRPYPAILTACAFASLLLINAIIRQRRQKQREP